MGGLWLGAAAVAALLVAERLRPRRVRTEAEPARTMRNVALGLIDLGVVAGVQQPLARRLAAGVEKRRQGLAQHLPAPLRDVAAFLLLDWSMYHWHVATHRVPLLWRLHAVHHVDRDMDASTALRFHVLDMMISVGLRAAQVRVLGVSPRALAAWERFFFASVLFHHADLDVPGDAGLAWLLTTPGMHDIHHRADAASLDANFSSGLSVWDRLHGTFADTAPDVPIGVPGLAVDQGLVTALLLPFRMTGADRVR
ncbi:sterol desaturase family protein [Sandarakinorhabdus sp. DWP1-3-1]|uniref:sterol desaturase family protein n=1 Tax=Sandarakinorhabdus sp. DWP1-3-1 TaxID=2804627 RepID=UPI003CF38734